MAIGRIPEPGTGIPESIVDAKGDIVTATAGDTPARLAVGTNEQRLVADSGEATGLKYVADTTNYAIAAKGDLLVGTAADTLDKLSVGSNDQILVADSSTSTGLKYTNSLSDMIIKGFEEDVNVVAAAATGTINFDVSTASVWYYTSNATANHTLNFRYSSGVSLNTALATGDAITLVWLNTNGSTAYYPNVIQIDGNAVTPKVPAAISAGNASAIDAYSFTIIKTASATFTVLETQTKFA